MIDHLLRRSPHMTAIGLELDGIDGTDVTLAIATDPRHCEGSGAVADAMARVHPGMIVTLADSASAATTYLATGRTSATASLRIDYISAVAIGAQLTARATMNGFSDERAIVSCTVFADGVCVAQSLAQFALGPPHNNLAGSVPADEAAGVADDGVATSGDGSTDGSTDAIDERRGYLGTLRQAADAAFAGDLRLATLSPAGRSRGEPVTVSPLTLPSSHLLIGNPTVPALHGGVIAAFLIDCARERAAGVRVAGIDIDYLRVGVPRDLHGAAEIIREGRSSITLRAAGWQASREEPVAVASVRLLRDDTSRPAP